MQYEGDEREGRLAVFVFERSPHIHHSLTPPPSYPQVLVFERGPLVFVFNWSPTKDYEGYKVRRGKEVVGYKVRRGSPTKDYEGYKVRGGKGGKGYKVRGAGAGRGGRKGGGGRVMRGGADEEALCRPE